MMRLTDPHRLQRVEISKEPRPRDLALVCPLEAGTP